jgi:RsiW-degrading membrane proteinase PrsW (M82 family)
MTGKPPHPIMPPVPRDHEDASFSELVPFRSSKIDLKRSPVMLFALVTAIAVPFLFALLTNMERSQDVRQSVSMFATMANIAVFYILLCILVGLFSYSRSSRPIWVFGLGFLAVAIFTATPPIFTALAFPFRGIYPGIVPMAFSENFLSAFLGMFVAAGLTEESIKAIPTLFGAFLSFHLMKQGKTQGAGFAEKFRIRGPLDGVVMGLFCGAGFIMAETAFEYVPRQFNTIAQQTGSFEAGVASALSLLLPRVFGGITGHMGYSAIFGYFIGLAVIRPKRKWKLIGIGFLGASLVHGLWNSVGQLHPLLYYGVAIATALVAVACLLKARQMEMAARGPAEETFGSIIVERAPAAAVAPVPFHPAAPPAAQAFTQPLPHPVAEKPLGLDVDGIVIPLRAGGTVDLGAEPALAGRGAGVVGMVIPHPTRANVLGLRNGGSGAWTARLRDGSQQLIERDQNVRLAAGVEIHFGGGQIGRVVAIG